MLLLIFLRLLLRQVIITIIITFHFPTHLFTPLPLLLAVIRRPTPSSRSHLLHHHHLP